MTIKLLVAVFAWFLNPSQRVFCDDSVGSACRADVSGTCSNLAPVVLIHWSLSHCVHCQANPSFLQESIAVAKRSGNRVILIGDRENKGIAGAEWYDVARYMESAAQFEKVYQHLSSNAHSYELACFQRMFILRDFMLSEGIAAALHIDSDVLLLANINDVMDTECISSGGGAWLRPLQAYTDWWWVESVATALFSLPLLDDLCAFMTDLYTTPNGLALLQRKMDGWVLERGGEGGVCDMSAYFLFSNCVSAAPSLESAPRPNAFPDPEDVCPRIRRLVDVGDLTGEWSRAIESDQTGVDFGGVGTCTRDAGVFDLNINEANGFRMACDDEERRLGCVKGVAWRDGEAWARRADGGAVRMLSLHLQGGAKGRMAALSAAYYASLRPGTPED